jgi:hypothetical protein
MFNLLDIAYPGRPYRPRPRIIIDNDPDTLNVIQPEPDTAVSVPDGADSIIPQEIIDTLTNKEGVMDTIRAAANFFTDLGAGNGHSSSLLMTTLVVVAALTLCAGCVWMYRRNIQSHRGI